MRQGINPKPTPPNRYGRGSGYDPKMMESAFIAAPRGAANAPGPHRSTEDDPERAKFIDELQAKWRHQ
jgi:hypothetical protein